MTRVAALFILSLLASSAVPVFAQGNSELLGAPGHQAAEEAAAKRAVARKQVEEQLAQTRARTKRRAEQAAADQAQLAEQAEDLRAREALLKDREEQLAAEEEELAAEEQRLARLRAEIEDERQIAEAAREPRNPLPERPAPGRPSPERLALDNRPVSVRLDASIRSCTFAGEDRALSQDFMSARYVRPPRLYRRQDTFDDVWQLRGVMRLEDWGGYRHAETICELDSNGRVRYFTFVR